MEDKAIILYKPAAEAIKTAILQGQYEAAKGVNRMLTMCLTLCEVLVWWSS